MREWGSEKDEDREQELLSDAVLNLAHNSWVFMLLGSIGGSALTHFVDKPFLHDKMNITLGSVCKNVFKTCVDAGATVANSDFGQTAAAITTHADRLFMNGKVGLAITNIQPDIKAFVANLPQNPDMLALTGVIAGIGVPYVIHKYKEAVKRPKKNTQTTINVKNSTPV